MEPYASTCKLNFFFFFLGLDIILSPLQITSSLEEKEKQKRKPPKKGKRKTDMIYYPPSTKKQPSTRIAEIQTLIPKIRAMVDHGKRLQQEGILSAADADEKDNGRLASWLAFLRKREEGAKEMVPLQLGIIGVHVQCVDL